MAFRAIRDLRCDACNVVYDGVLCELDEYGDCEQCGQPLKHQLSWNGANGGLFGAPKYSDASGQYHSSQRDKEMFMARHGYHPAGDKVGGARKTLRVEGSAFSYPGQRSRASTAERSQTRDP